MKRRSKTLPSFGANVAAKTQASSLAAAIILRVQAIIAALGDDFLPVNDDKHKQLLASLLVWLIRVQGPAVGQLGKRLIGPVGGVDFEDKQARVRLRSEVMHGKKQRIWNRESLTILEEVARLLAGGGTFSVDFNPHVLEHFLVFEVPGQARIAMGVDQLRKLQVELAISKLCDEVKWRQENLPQIRLLTIQEHDVRVWTGLLKDVRSQ